MRKLIILIAFLLVTPSAFAQMNGNGSGIYGAGGGGSLSGLTTGYIPQAGSATTIINSNPVLDNGITKANTLTYAGSGGFQLPSDGTHAGATFWAGNTTAPTIPTSNYFGILGPNSTSFTTYVLQFSSTAPSGGQVPNCATPVSNISTCTWSQGSPSLNNVTGSAAQATGTETAAGNEYTFAGVETANLTYPFVFQDTGSGSTTSGALGIQTVTGTGMVPVIVNEKTAAGDIMQLWSGAAGFTNGVFSGAGGTKEFDFGSNGLFNAGTEVTIGTAPATSCGTGFCLSGTEGTIATGLASTDTISSDSTNHCFHANFNNTDYGCLAGLTPAQTFAGAITHTGGIINTTTPIRDETNFVLVSAMTGANGTVGLGTTGASNATFSWPVTSANWYNMVCHLPVTFAASATIRFELYSVSGAVTISSVSAETTGNTGASSAFQDLTTINGASLAGSETPATGAPGASITVSYNSQFLTSHAGNIGIEFVGNGTNNVTMLSGGTCGITQIN